MRFFNTAGPVREEDHYMIDPLSRWDMEEIMTLIEQKKYFVLHAPRQTGKTSCMFALRDRLNREGKYFAVYSNVETAQAALYNVKDGLGAIISRLVSNLEDLLDPSIDVRKYYKDNLDNLNPLIVLNEFLKYICQKIDKPIVLMLDEIDSLIGDTLISVLRQLRDGYNDRPKNFPSSIILCGIRDVRDYRIRTSTNEIVTGGSAFNIKAESLRLGNFTKDDVINLYKQHTEEIGRVFTDDCYDIIMKYTDGQPWLVNALAYEVVWKIKENRPASVVITPEKIEQAKENLILARQTHLDQIVDKLREERVKSIILPMILGEETDFNDDDSQYCIDLGLIKREGKDYKIANSIYSEIIQRILSNTVQDNMLNIFPKPVWVENDVRLNMKTMLTLFKDFWWENSGIVTEKMVGYREATPQLVLQGFLQRIVNGGGYINREYGLGRKRVDMMIKWFYPPPTLPTPQATWGGQIQKIVLELKVISKRQGYERVKSDGIVQTAEYTKYCGESEAHLLIFDRDNSQKWTADEANEIVEFDGVKIEIWKLGRMEDD